ncbi:cytochrome P450 family protein [Abortiporus biennis]
MDSAQLLLAIAALAIALTPWIRRKRFIKQHAPPGPPGLPLLGNVLDLSRDAWIPFTNWKKTYGDVVYLDILGQPMIILNSLKIATDLLDRRSSVYSDRPRSIVASEFLCGGMSMIFMNYDARTKLLRRAMHGGLTKQASANYQPFRIREGVPMIKSLLDDPKNWQTHLENSIIKLSLSILYGLPSSDSDRQYAIEKAKWFGRKISHAAEPGNYLVEFLPWMKYFPRSVAKWKDEAVSCFEESSAFFMKMYENGRKDAFDKNGQLENMSKALHRDQEQFGIDDPHASWLMALLYVAGFETTQSQLAWFVIAMAKYQDVQKEAQDELDTVVGRSRMPNTSDIEHLPYLQAIVKELLRWVPAGPLGIPHYSTQDDWYNGYLIPKGTIVISNIWGINRDVGIYGDDVEEFNPSRFLDSDGNIFLSAKLSDTRGDGHSSFGFGKRVCAGKNLAEDNLHMFMAYMLWALNIQPARNERGETILFSPSDFHNTGITIRPQQYECIFLPRFPDVEEILENSQESLVA